MASKILRPAEGHPRHSELNGAVVGITKTRGHGIRKGCIQIRVSHPITGENTWLEPMTLEAYNALNPVLETAKAS